MTEWRNMPEDVRNALEQLCCPATGSRREMTVEIGRPITTSGSKPREFSSFVVDEAVFDSIRGFVEANAEDFEKAEISGSKMVLLLGEEVAADLKM